MSSPGSIPRISLKMAGAGVLLACFSPTSFGFAAGPLFPNPIYPLECQWTHCRTESLQFADINQDLIPDIISSGNPTTTLFGRGHGDFQIGQNFAGVGRSIAADFNADGIMDLLATESSGLALRLGLGDGAFESPIGLGFIGFLGLVADLNHDSALDIVASSYGHPHLLKGDGSGKFSAPESLDVGEGYGTYATSGDFNGDGYKDLALGEGGGSSVHVLLGSPSGEFALHSSFMGAYYSLNGLAAADFNHDGADDLAVVSSYWYAGDGACVFLAGESSVASDAGRDSQLLNSNLFGWSKQCYRGSINAWDITTADLNEDGNADLVVADHGLHNYGSPGDLFVMLGDGRGDFATNTPVGARIYSGTVAVGDANQDGHPDLAVINAHTGELAILFGTGDGSNFRQVLGNETLSGVAVGDVNADGLADLVTPEYVLLADRIGSVFKRKPLGASSRGRLVLGDLNNDGHVDVTGVICATGEIEVLLGRGNGVFQRPRYTRGGNCGWWYQGPAPLELGDMNADGNLDLLMGTGIGLGRGDGSFDVEPWPPPLSGGLALASGDFNLDGIPDAALSVGASNQYPYEDRVHIMLGSKSGVQASSSVVRVGDADVTAMAVGDFNRDGKLDLVLSTYYPGLLFVPGNGDGTFGSPREYWTTCFPTDMTVADFDGDGDLDIAQAGSAEPTCLSSGVLIMFGDGDGGFPASRKFGSGLNLRISHGDLNGDGRTDLVGLGGYSFDYGSRLSLLLNHAEEPLDGSRWLTFRNRTIDTSGARSTSPLDLEYIE